MFPLLWSHWTLSTSQLWYLKTGVFFVYLSPSCTMRAMRQQAWVTLNFVWNLINFTGNNTGFGTFIFPIFQSHCGAEWAHFSQYCLEDIFEERSLFLQTVFWNVSLYIHFKIGSTEQLFTCSTLIYVSFIPPEQGDHVSCIWLASYTSCKQMDSLKLFHYTMTLFSFLPNN